METVVILRENPSKNQMLSVKSQILGSFTELQKVRQAFFLKDKIFLDPILWQKIVNKVLSLQIMTITFTVHQPFTHH